MFGIGVDNNIYGQKVHTIESSGRTTQQQPATHYNTKSPGMGTADWPRGESDGMMDISWVGFDGVGACSGGGGGGGGGGSSPGTDPRMDVGVMGTGMGGVADFGDYWGMRLN